ncbi:MULTISPECIES: hypothetical protein [unclassified Geodermatophilus]
MNARLVLAGLIWAAVSVVAFLAIPDVIVASGLVIFGAVLLLVLFMARDWDTHSSFEEREMLRARRRKDRWERTAGSRARDRERWEAHQARKAARSAGADDAPQR